MAKTGADLFVGALEQYDVTHLFGNPGTTELPVVQALPDSELDYVLGLHEDIAVGMAAGYASRRRYHRHHDPSVNPLGVVNLHLAPGLAHGLGNLDGARWAGAPLLVTTGQHTASFRHEEPILSGDMARMAEPFTKWSASVDHVDAVPTMVRRAVRQALTPPTGPVFLELPVDVMTAETDLEPKRLGDIPTAGRGDADAIARAADVLAEADEPILVLGDQVARSGFDAVESAVDLAETTGAAVYAEFLMGEVSFPTEHEQWIASVPGTEDAFAAVHDTDTIVFVGISSHTTPIRHEIELVPDDARTVHIDNDSWELGKNFGADVAVLGDPGRVMTDLAEQLEGRIDARELDRRFQHVEDRKRYAPGDDENSEVDRLSKPELVRALNRVDPDAYLVAEAVTTSLAVRQEYPMEAEQYVSNTSGGLGYGLPATVGAGIAEEEVGSDRNVVGIVADGSYLYYPHTLYSAARHDVDVTVVIPDNRNYRILKDNALRLLGGEEEDYDFVGMDFDPSVDFPANAVSHGAKGDLVSNPEDVEAALERALHHDGPFVLDVLVHD